MSAIGIEMRLNDPARKASAVNAWDACTAAVLKLEAKVLCGRRITIDSAAVTWACV